MSVYQTDDEQVEALKKWWKENGKSVIGGIVLGFAIIGGWQGWQGWQRSAGESASVMFDTLRQAVRTGQIDQAVEDGKRLIGEQGGTVYASFAGLELARLAYQKGEKTSARGHLQWVADSAPDPSLREVARLRLGHLLLDMAEHEPLQVLLAQTPLAAFAGEFSMLRGDLARALGDQAEARQAYTEALAVGVEDETLLRMKLVDVGGSSPAT
jgi:predicted negative regulator of RcsB-dependent stress response